MIDLTSFLDNSPTSFHAALTIRTQLDEMGFTMLREEDSWSLKSGYGYYILRDERAVMAFIPGQGSPADDGLRIAAAHLDSPGLKVKMDAVEQKFGAWRIPVEVYGSPIQRTWLDRELEAAGLVSISDGNGGIMTRRWRSNIAVAVIPSLALHLDKEVNKGAEINIQQHLAALAPIHEANELNPLVRGICDSLNCGGDDILSAEIYLVPAAKSEVIGGNIDNGLLVSSRLDNLAMAHAILSGMPIPEAGTQNSGPGILAAWFDAEEVGSRTANGALSLFMDEIIERLVLASGGGREDLMRTRRRSFMVSADMAHAVHPNYADKHDPGYAPRMGGGPVLKSHGQRHYATDVHSEARMNGIAARSGISMQKLIFRSDIACGFSLGPLASAGTSIPAVDIGSPLWGMHSSRETASLSDHKDMIKLFQELWSA